MAKMLTAAGLGRMRGARVRREVRDGGAAGLYLAIEPSGKKVWYLRFRRPDGRSAKLRLGECDLSGALLQGAPKIGDPLSVANARILAAETNALRARGVDVMAQRPAADLTFAALAAKFLEEHVKPKTRRWRETERVLGGLAGAWKGKLAAAITGDDVHRLVDECRRRGIPGLGVRNAGISDPRGRAVARVLSKLFSWATQHRLVPSNPTLGMYVPAAVPARDRVLTNDEIIRVWHACDKIGSVHGRIVRTLLLTGQRLSEVAQMSRTELDGATWSIPWSRTKNKRPHVLILPALVRSLLAGDAPYVFTVDGVRPVRHLAQAKGRLDAAMGPTEPWRLHDLRRTCATGMAELGIAPHIIEAVLNHVSGAKAGVAGIYNRAVYSDEKRAALERWAAHVEGLVTGRDAKVVSIRGSA